MGQEPEIITSESWRKATNTIWLTERPAGFAFPSLSRRRAWYADDPSTSDGEDGSGDGQQDNADKSDGTDGGQDSKSEGKSLENLNPQQLIDYIGELRGESAKWRTEVRKLQTAQEKAEAERKQAEEAELAKQGEFKTLAEQRAAELEALKPKADQADALLERISKQNAARIDKIPEELRTVVPADHMDPVALSEWLDQNEEKLLGERAPSLDGGKRGSGSRTPADPKKVLNKRRRKL